MLWAPIFLPCYKEFPALYIYIYPPFRKTNDDLVTLPVQKCLKTIVPYLDFIVLH